MYIYRNPQNTDIMSGGLMVHKSHPVTKIDRTIRVVSKLNSQLLKLEPELNQSKWFDYRFMSAIDATQELFGEYIKAYKKEYSKMFDIDEAKRKFGARHVLLFKNDETTITAAWKARQAADSIGCTYEFYAIEAMKFLIEGRIYQRVPRINQLYSDVVVNKITELWEERLRDILVTTRDPRYKVENYRGLDAQDEYIAYQLVIADIRPRKDITLSNFSILQKTLSEEDIVNEFGVETLNLLDNSFSDFPDPEMFDVDLENFDPACFSLGHAFDKKSKICQSCHAQDNCSLESKELLNRLHKEHGSDDPKLAKKREQANKRKRRQRERERVA